MAESEVVRLQLISDILVPPTTAKVGQVIVVEAVDANGRPTKWKAVDSFRSLLTPGKAGQVATSDGDGGISWGRQLDPACELIDSITVEEDGIASIIFDGFLLSEFYLEAFWANDNGQYTVNRSSRVIPYDSSGQALGTMATNTMFPNAKKINSYWGKTKDGRHAETAYVLPQGGKGWNGQMYSMAAKYMCVGGCAQVSVVAATGNLVVGSKFDLYGVRDNA